MRRVNLSPRTWRMGTTLFVSVVLLFGFLLSIALMAYAASDATVDVDARLTDGELQIQIQDWGQWRAPRGMHRGRGLGLMRGLMDEVAVRPGGTGTLVTMRRTLRREVPV